LTPAVVPQLPSPERDRPISSYSADVGLGSGYVYALEVGRTHRRKEKKCPAATRYSTRRQKLGALEAPDLRQMSIGS